MDPMIDIEDPSDFTLFNGDPENKNPKAELNIPKHDPPLTTSSQQEPVKKQKYQNQQINFVPENRNSHVQSVPNNNFQMNLIANSMLTQELLMQQNVQLQQNAALMVSSEMWPGMLEGNMYYPSVNPLMMNNNLTNPHLSQINNYLLLQQLNNSEQLVVPQEIPSPMEVSNIPTPDQISLPEVRPTRPNYTTEIIKCQSCTLYPPKNSKSIPLASKKYIYCKTIWVGGLPKNITENIIHEVFERFGEFQQLRKKNQFYCHIRYKNFESVDDAIALSGYRLVIGDSENPDDSGLIFVDYSKSREDILEWEQSQNSNKPKTPPLPPIIPCTTAEINDATEKIKNNTELTGTLELITSWFNKGACNKHNATNFYNIIQTASAQAKRLKEERDDHQMAVKKVKLLAKKTVKEIATQINEIEKFFGAVCQQKVWDHFSKLQRKAINTWKDELHLAKSSCDDVDMEISDDDEPSTKKIKLDIGLQEKNEKLRCEIEAYKNEIAVLKINYKTEHDDLNRRIELLTNSLKTSKDEIMNLKIERSADVGKITELEEFKRKSEAGPNKSLEKKLQKLRNEFSDLKTAKNKGIDKLQGTIKDMEKAIRENKKKYEELKDLKTAKDKEIEKLQIIIKQMEKYVKENEKINAEIKTVKNLHNESQNKLKDLEKKHSRLLADKNALETKQKDYDNTEIELQLLKTKAAERIMLLHHELAETKLLLTANKNAFNSQDTRLIGLISTFLLPYCLGAKLDDILAFVKRFNINISENDLESLMGRCYAAFKKNSDGCWVLNIYNETENAEVKEETTTTESLQRLSQIVDSVSEATATTSKEEFNKETNKYVQMVNTTNKLSNFNKEAKQFIKELKDTKPSFQSEVSDFLKELNTSLPLSRSINTPSTSRTNHDFTVVTEDSNSSFQQNLDTLKKLGIRRLRLGDKYKVRLINILNKYPLSSTWSDQLTNIILLLRPISIPFDESFYFTIRCKDTFCSFHIPPTTQEKMKSLMYFKFPPLLPEEMNSETEPMECVDEEQNMETDSDNFNIPKLRKRKLSDDSIDIKETKYKKRCSSGNLNELTAIYEIIKKEDKTLLENLLEPPFHIRLLPHTLNEMFKHIIILKPLLKQIQDDQVLKEHFSVLSVEYFTLLKNIIKIIPIRYEDTNISNEKVFKATPSDIIDGKLIIKHARRAEKRLKKLQEMFSDAKEFLLAGQKMSNNYQNLFTNILDYLKKLSCSLNMISESIDRIKMQNIIKISDNNSNLCNELEKMYSSSLKKFPPFEYDVLVIDVMENEIRTLRSNISGLRVVLGTLEEHLKKSVDHDYQKHFSDLADNYFIIIEKVVTHFTIKSLNQEENMSTDLSIIEKSIEERLDFVNNIARSSQKLLNSIKYKFKDLSLPGSLGEEIFSDCEPLFKGIVNYLENLDESLNVFRAITLKTLTEEGTSTDNKVEKPDNKIENPDNKIEEPDNKIEEPDIKIEDPDNKIEEPDNKIEEPDIKIEEPEIKDSGILIEELQQKYLEFLEKNVSLKSVKFSEIGKKRIRELYLFTHSIHKLVTELRLHFTENFKGIKIGKSYLSNLSEEYFVIIKNIVNQFPIENFIENKGSKNVNNNIKTIITRVLQLFRCLRTNFFILVSEYFCGKKVYDLCKDLFGSVQKYLSNLESTLIIIRDLNHTGDEDSSNSSIAFIYKQIKFTGNLEELRKFYDEFSKTTNPLFIDARKQIDNNILKNLKFRLNNIRIHLSSICFYMNSLTSDIKCLNLEEAFYQVFPKHFNEYFTIINNFFNHFPSTRSYGNIPEIQNIFSYFAPPVERAKLMKASLDEVLKQIFTMKLREFPWEIKNFADTRNFFESLVRYLTNSLQYALRNMKEYSKTLCLILINTDLCITNLNLHQDTGKVPNQNENNVNNMDCNFKAICQNESKTNLIDKKLSSVEIQKDVSEIHNQDKTENEDKVNDTESNFKADSQWPKDIGGVPNQNDMESNSKVISDRTKDHTNFTDNNMSSTEINEVPTRDEIDNNEIPKQVKIIENENMFNDDNDDSLQKPDYAECNLKAMIETSKMLNSIQFPIDVQNLINENFVNSMLRADEHLAKLHVNIILIRGMMSHIKDFPAHHQVLYSLSENYFVIFMDFLGLLPIPNEFNITNNYKKASKAKLVLDVSTRHSGTIKMLIRRVRRTIPKLRIQFEQIRNITINDVKVFSKCQDFFETVFQYFRNLHCSFRRLRVYLNSPECTEFYRQVYADCKIFPIHSLMIDNKFSVCFNEKITNENKIADNSLIVQKSEEVPHKIDDFMFKKPKTPTENITKYTNKTKNKDLNKSNDMDLMIETLTPITDSNEPGTSKSMADTKSDDLKNPETPCDKLNSETETNLKIPEKQLNITTDSNQSKNEDDVRIEESINDSDVKNKDNNEDLKVVNDFAKSTQDLRNELDELFGGFQQSEGPFQCFNDIIGSHVGADDC